MANATAGTQKQLLETIQRIDRARFSPHLICLWESPWMQTVTMPCPVHIIGYSGFLKWSFASVVRRLGGLVDDLDIRLVHIFFDESIIVGWFGGRRARRQPVLISSRRDMGLGAGNQPWYHRLFPLVLPWINRSFAGIVANCETVKLYAARREHTPLDRFTVIRNGVDIEPPRQTEPDLLIDTPSVVRVGIAASLTPVKRHDLLLQAWALLPLEGTAIASHLYFLGNGPEREALQTLAAHLNISNRVHFIGAVDDVPAWLQHLDAGVLCSDREGLSNAILEYMACGLPVIATAVGGNPELVNQDNGILVPPGDPEALAQALVQLIDDADMRRRLGAASLRRASESFSWDRTMEQLMTYYDALLAGSKN